MGDKVKVQRWAPVDPDGAGLRNWVDGRTEQKRALCSAAPLGDMQSAVNHLLAQRCRVMFSQLLTSANYPTTTSNPFFQWRWMDDCKNGRWHRLSVVHRPRVDGSYSDGPTDHATIVALDNSLSATAYESTGYYGEATSGTSPQNVLDEGLTRVRGALADSEQIAGIKTNYGYAIRDVCVQDFPLDVLTDEHEYVGTPPNPGDPITEGTYLSDLRDGLTEARANNLPIPLSWAAPALDGTYATTALTAGSPEELGIRLQSTSYVNVIGTAFTSRTASSPGWHCHVQNLGIGSQSTDRGRWIKLICRVFGHSTGSGSGYVKFEGPIGWVSNSVEIEVPVAGASAWCGTDSDWIYLDASQADTVSGLAGNKVDVFGKAAASSNLYIHGLRAWIVAA